MDRRATGTGGKEGHGVRRALLTELGNVKERSANSYAYNENKLWFKRGEISRYCKAQGAW